MIIPPPTGTPLNGAQVSRGSVRVSTPIPQDHPARSGWISGTVSGTLPDGGLSVSTRAGPLTISGPSANFPVGTPLEVRVDGSIVRFQPLVQAGALAGTPQTAPPGGIFDGAPLPQALFEMAPVAAGVAGQAQAAQVLTGVFPHVGSAAFSAIAALFPQIVRDGTLKRLNDRHNAKFGAGDHLSRIAASALAQAVNPSDDPAHLRWTMPFYADGTLHQSRWQHMWVEDAAGEKSSHTYLEVTFAFTGTLRVTAHMHGNELTLHMISERMLPAALITELKALITELTEAVGLSTRFSHVVAQA